MFRFSSSSNLYSASHSPYTYCRSASLPRGRAVLFRCRTFPSRENVGKGYIIVALVMLLGCENVSPFRHGASSGSSVLTAGALMIRNSCGWEKGGGSWLAFSANFKFQFQISSLAILKGCCHRIFSEGTRYCSATDFFRLFVVSSQDSVLFHKFLFSYGQKQLVSKLVLCSIFRNQKCFRDHFSFCFHT